MAPQDIHVVIPRTCECYLTGKKDFVDVSKDREMGKSTLIIQVGPTCNHRCLYKRKAEGDLMMVNTGRDQRSRTTSGHYTLRKTREEILPWRLQKEPDLSTP